MIKKKISSNIIKINNVFPRRIINKINALFFKERNWKLIDQVRKNHYSHVFKSESDFTPDSMEIYYAKFYRSFKLQKNKIINKEIQRYIFPILKKLNIKFKKTDIRCHKFKTDNFLRTHFDHYAGKYAININLNKKWKADWGGNLCILDGKNFENIQTLVPEYNSINIMTSKKNEKQTPHFVTRVERFAKEPRFSITIFLY